MKNTRIYVNEMWTNQPYINTTQSETAIFV